MPGLTLLQLQAWQALDLNGRVTIITIHDSVPPHFGRNRDAIQMFLLTFSHQAHGRHTLATMISSVICEYHSGMCRPDAQPYRCGALTHGDATECGMRIVCFY